MRPVTEIRAESHVYRQGASTLRHWAGLALAKGEWRRAAQLYTEAKALEAEGDGVLVKELEGSLKRCESY